MEVEFLLLLLRYAATFVALGVVNTSLAAAAFRVNLGAGEFPLEAREFWQRSAVAGFALAAYAFAAAFVSVIVFHNAYWLFGVLMIGYAILAVYLYNYAYGLDDLLEGFKIFLIHHALPVLILAAVFVFFKGDAFVRFVLPTT